MRVEPVQGTELLDDAADATIPDAWRALDGPPVPVAIARDAWQLLITAALTTQDALRGPRVFRLFMRRGEPRMVVRAVEIESVWRNERGILRWSEGGYPPLSALERKGGNAFVRGDSELGMHDAWWMGREQTDLRILLRREGLEHVCFSAWWARGGTTGLNSRHETDGEVLPVRLLLRYGGLAMR